MCRNGIFSFLYLAATLACFSNAENSSVWRWACEDGKCVKHPLTPADMSTALSLEACKMFCDKYGILWPHPTGQMTIGHHLSKININSIDVQVTKNGRADPLLQAAGQRFLQVIAKTLPKGVTAKSSGKTLTVHLVTKDPNLTEFSLNFDESYNLQVSGMADTGVNATITAANFFGARHGLETLAQLIFYDDIRQHLLIVRDASIGDKPVYPYRGILLDTARNYFSIDSILRTIDAMAAVKLNTFHWHITDSHSFPFVAERRPNLSKYGAYAPHKVFTKENIRRVVEYGRVRGVRVLPEFDAPAHVGEGWQDTNLTVCFKAEPWAEYCVEPPCGQLNPIKDELYNVLEDIYQDMADYFQPDMFHMGGDEVSYKCWNSSEEIQQFMIQNRWDPATDGLLELWNYFQTKAQDRVYKAFGKKIPLIMWTSKLTDYKHVTKYLNKDDYIIQVWTSGIDIQINHLLTKGYRLILSNYDALYFDCGFGAWVGSGNNWCSPYIGWQKVYENSPKRIAGYHHDDKIMGGEAALWSEQVDEASLDGRLWPRAAAMAERLWAEPQTSWADAEHRILNVRERLIKLGVQAESIQPEWCYKNEGYCIR